MRYKPNYNAKKHGEKYIILDWAGNIVNFGKKSIIIFDDLLDADQYLDEQMDKMSKLKDEQEIIKNDYNNNFDKWFEDTRNEFYILKCKNVFTNYICDPFGFTKAINI
tara:strand:+ start:1621 stop:1944 length:324 start_codon:yes stop_codon:yes gene_type:complete